MEGRVGNKDYKIAVVGSRLLAIGSKLAGISSAYNVTEPEEVESTLRTLMQRDDIGIIIIAQTLAKKIRDRKLTHAIENSLMPLVIEVADFNEPQNETDQLRKMILRAVGIDINKMANK
ncbi:MAG TPA: V-type ATP synthase subunit F [Candidatus Aquilonibacter sp.]|nr:V-type ATP synthase subunit F [Candidatus Aquilonibacter sp.]